MKTPVYTISGFLGSGKTTFLNQLLPQLPEESKVAIIVNEFGKIPIDGKIIERQDYLLQEITQGCICCTLKARLADSLISIVDNHKPDLILIETTGVARPKQITDEFHVKRLSERVVPRGIVCFLDAAVYVKVGNNLPIINFQIEEADVLILNKVDLLNTETLSAARAGLRAFAGDRKTIYETSFSSIDCRAVFPELSTSRRPGDKESIHGVDLSPASFVHDHDDLLPVLNQRVYHEHLDSTQGFTSISLKSSRVVPYDLMISFLTAHKDRIVRAKGILRTDKGNKTFQFSSSGIEVTDFDRKLSEGQLVVIVKDEDREYVGNSLPDGFTLFE
jgi:G3E family GTPase